MFHPTQCDFQHEMKRSSLTSLGRFSLCRSVLRGVHTGTEPRNLTTTGRWQGLDTDTPWGTQGAKEKADARKIKSMKQRAEILWFTATDPKLREYTKSFECWNVRWPLREPPKWVVSWHPGGLPSDLPQTLRPQIRWRHRCRGSNGHQGEKEDSWETVTLFHTFPSWTPSSPNQQPARDEQSDGVLLKAVKLGRLKCHYHVNWRDCSGLLQR